MNKLLAAITCLLTVGAAFAQALVDGEVTKVDKPAARVTIRHGGIKNLDMPPMAMAFKAADPKQLEGLAAGDKVRFAAERVNGVYTVTTLTKTP
ncbi:MAG: copper-binding protein [Rubrivivax sp.]